MGLDFRGSGGDGCIDERVVLGGLAEAAVLVRALHAVAAGDGVADELQPARRAIARGHEGLARLRRESEEKTRAEERLAALVQGDLASALAEPRGDGVLRRAIGAPLETQGSGAGRAQVVAGRVHHAVIHARVGSWSREQARPF